MKIKQALNPTRILAVGFPAIALLGAALLMLPVATVDGVTLSFWDALFTSTSAVCVTGLTVVNTGAVFTLFGQIVILFLIQIGGLGFMTVASMLFLAVGKRFSLRERLIIQESFNQDSLQGLVRLVRRTLLIALTVELAGALLLAITFVPAFGWGRGGFYSLFLAVSAFCNAGFDPLGMANSIEAYQADPMVNIPIMLLIIVGGLGFAVVIDCMPSADRCRRRMLHTRIVLWMTATLLVVGAALIALVEWNNPATLNKEGMNAGEKIMAAFFQSTTSRTAGFDCIGQAGMTPAGKLITDVLMFIGASPAGTGGGIKTTTFFAVMLAVWSITRKRQDYTVGKRRLGEQTVRRAFAIMAIGLVLVVTETLTISIIETAAGHSVALDDVLFEVISGFSTTGLSCSLTPQLQVVSRLLLTVTMLIGRVGPLTVSMALAGDATAKNAVRYPEDRLMVG